MNKGKEINKVMKRPMAVLLNKKKNKNKKTRFFFFFFQCIKDQGGNLVEM